MDEEFFKLQIRNASVELMSEIAKLDSIYDKLISRLLLNPKLSQTKIPKNELAAISEYVVNISNACAKIMTILNEAEKYGVNIEVPITRTICVNTVSLMCVRYDLDRLLLVKAMIAETLKELVKHVEEG